MKWINTYDTQIHHAQYFKKKIVLQNETVVQNGLLPPRST